MIAFEDVLDVAANGYSSASADVRACITALTLANGLDDDLPSLRAVRKNLAADRRAVRQGALVVAVLRAKLPCAIAAWVTLVAPGTWPLREDAEKSKRRALKLHADAYLALGSWVANWNRRQIRRVA